MRIVPILFVILFSACSTAGPFVTSISSDGAGVILIEKCQVHLNAFMGTISNDSCTNYGIRLNQKQGDSK